MAFDATSVYLVLVFAAVFAAAQAAVGLLRTAKVKQQVNRRLLVAERTGGGIAELVVELRKQRGLNAAGDARGGWAWLSELVVRSGVPYDGRRWLAVVAGLTLVGAILGFAGTRQFLMIPVGAALLGVVGPLGYLKFKADRRAVALGQQLPQALEIIVRSLEAGHPVPTAVSAFGVAYDAKTDRIFVGSQGSDNVVIVDAKSGKVLHDVKVGAGTLNVVFDPARNLAYVANRASDTVTILAPAGDRDYDIVAVRYEG